MSLARTSTPLRRTASRLVGRLADIRIPGPLRGLVFGAYCSLTGADPKEARLDLADFPSLNAFFIRQLKEGAREIAPDPDLPSPCDGRVQAVAPLERGALLQAKGIDYPLAELCGGCERGLDLEGAHAWTLYLSPRDYHRVHAPLAGELTDVAWLPGARYSVRPGVAASLRGLFAANERAVLRFETERGPYLLVMVGALNVGRIRVVGVGQGETPAAPRRFGRGEEVARFEMGSTVILVLPRELGYRPTALSPGDPVRLGGTIGTRPPGGPPMSR